MIRIIGTTLFLLITAQLAFAEQTQSDIKPWDKWAKANPGWVAPQKPFKVIDNIYYVGTQGIASYLITSADGHILLDGGMPQNPPLIIKSIAELGFDIGDIKILLNSHAHFDHSGGLAELKQLTGAKMIASRLDTKALETGLYPGSVDLEGSAPAVQVDQQLDHEERITLGGISMKANITPGHTPGCTSWTTTATLEREEYEVLFFCSASVAGNRLVGPPQYPGIVDDYRLTFERTKNWQPDVLLSNHPIFFGMKDKLDKLHSGDELAFVDTAGFRKLMNYLEASFEKSLIEQKSKLERSGDE